MIQYKQILLTLVALFAISTGAWADDYTITLPTVSNGSVVAKVSDVSVTSAAAGATVSLVATPDAGYKLKTISATCIISETFSSGANTRTGTYFSVSGSNYNYGWRIGSGDNYILTISSLSNQNLSQVVLTVGTAPNVSQRNTSHLQADHGTLSATGTTQGNTITITGINSPTVTVSAPGSNNSASMWSITQAKVDGLGAITLTDTSDDNVKTFTMPSGNVTVSAEFEEGPASTGPEVAWDKAKKTGLFTMPAGNVELQVEYFDDAVLAEGDVAPAAPADPIYVSTDAALVIAGTASQGTLMYLALPATADAPTKATEGWSADVPTASTITEPGTYNVYYYIVGDDEHSNSAILGPVAVEVLTDKYSIAFNAANALTIQDGYATVKVGDTDKTADIQDGKLAGVKYGQTVTITAATGYKFRKVEATKGISTLKSLKIGNYTVYYAEGETWKQALMRDENNNCGLETSVGYVFNYAENPLLDSGGNNVSEGSLIDPSKGYHFAD